MTPDVLTLLTEAAKQRRCAVIRYDGQHQIRVIEPHVIYIDAEGTIVVEGYQTQGYCETDAEPPLPSWRAFELKRIGSVFLLNTHFNARLAEGFVPDRPEYRAGLLAVVNDPVTTVRGARRGGETGSFLSRASDWWAGVGSAIDSILSDSHRRPRDH